MVQACVPEGRSESSPALQCWLRDILDTAAFFCPERAQVAMRMQWCAGSAGVSPANMNNSPVFPAKTRYKTITVDISENISCRICWPARRRRSQDAPVHANPALPTVSRVGNSQHWSAGLFSKRPYGTHAGTVEPFWVTPPQAAVYLNAKLLSH